MATTENNPNRGSHDQHGKGMEQNPKNTGGSTNDQGLGGQGDAARGGAREQQVKPGQQSHKNQGGGTQQR